MIFNYVYSYFFDSIFMKLSISLKLHWLTKLLACDTGRSIISSSSQFVRWFQKNLQLKVINNYTLQKLVSRIKNCSIWLSQVIPTYFFNHIPIFTMKSRNLEFSKDLNNLKSRKNFRPLWNTKSHLNYIQYVCTVVNIKLLLYAPRIYFLASVLCDYIY